MAAVRTRRKAKLGKYMRSLREGAPRGKVRTEDAAEHMKVATTTINRMESGDSLPQWPLLVGLCQLYGATSEEIAEAAQLWEAAKQDPTTVENAADLPAKYRAFRRDESEAVLERTMSPIAIPGMLQTRRYAAAAARAARFLAETDAPEDRATDERQSRQRLLYSERRDPPLRLHSLLDEAVLHRVVGGPDVMAEQCSHLLEAMRLPNVEVQIVPFDAGAYGTMSGPIVLLSFDDEKQADLAYLEYAGGGETVENGGDVRGLLKTFEEVSEGLALPTLESERLITAARKGYSER